MKFNGFGFLEKVSDKTKRRLVCAGLVLTSLSVSLLSGFLVGSVELVSIHKEQQNEIQEIYNQIPNFSLSTNGLCVDGDEKYTFSFAGKNLVINDSVEVVDMIMTEAYNGEEKFLVGKDGYMDVANGVIVAGAYFKDDKVLEGVTLTKENFDIIEGILSVHANVIKAVVLSIILLISVGFYFLRALACSAAITVAGKINGKKLVLGQVYKASLKAGVVCEVILVTSFVGLQSKWNLVAMAVTCCVQYVLTYMLSKSLIKGKEVG